MRERRNIVDRYKGNSWVKHWDFMLFDPLCLLAALSVGYWLRHGSWEVIDRPFYRELAFILVFADIAIAYFFESYRGILRRGALKELACVLKHITLTIVVAMVYLYVVKNSEEISRITLGSTYLLSLLFSYIMRTLLKSWLHNKKKAEKNTRALLLLAAGQDAGAIISQLRQYAYSKFHLVGVVLEDEGGEGGEFMGVPVVAVIDSLLSYIQTNWVDSIFVSLPVGHTVPQETLDQCVLMGVTVHFDINQFGCIGAQSIDKIGGYKVLSSSIVAGSERGLLAKRLMDIVGGMVGCVLTGVLFLFVAPWIYIKSPGPIFFSQERIGMGGRRFRIYKFRSMYTDAEERKKELLGQNQVKDGHMFKMENDPRIIPGVGHFIRKTSIDEFPQFFNVLRGDMSLVGTRPPTVEEWENYEMSHRARMAIRPGITGLWQISGRDRNIGFDEVVALDTKYIMEWSLGLDFKILAKTVFVVARRKGSC